MSSDGCNIIEHYQKAIKKARNDESKLLHCIGKLDALPITIDHLQRTGVGKTINSLRKYNGEVGEAAKGLVAKWKNMVASGEVTSSSPAPDKPNENGYSLNNEESEYSSNKNNNDDVRDIEAARRQATTTNGKHKDEKKHTDKQQRDSNHREEKRQSDSSHRHKEEKRNSDNDKDKHHREERRHQESQKDSSHHRNKDHHHHHESGRSSKSNGRDIVEKEKSHHKSSSSSSSRHTEKSSSSSSKSSSSKSSSSSKRHREDEKSHKRHSQSNDVGRDSPGPSSSSSSNQNDEIAATTEKHHHKAKKAKLIVNDGIDSSMGASFSDALGMCGVGSSKKNKKLQKVLDAMPPPETPRTSKSVVEKQQKPPADLIPEALKTSPKTKLDLSLNLPVAPPIKISDNYKPSPINQNVMNCIYPSAAPERPAAMTYDDLNIGITSKTMRTKVYSGVKTGALLSVPTLFNICIRVLQKNIDALEYTGGVPFDVLRPVLELTTPQQLLNFEDYNAYLLEDTDVLWQQHVGRHFRGQKREEGESWREMFMRCEYEKERRLSILTKNIKISQTQSALPIKKTRLAYVDNVVKPPRNIARKQEIYGTNDKLIASPAARVAALSSGSHNTVVAGDPRLKIGREVALATSNNALKIKKAPLMAKTLQFIKKTYKR